MPYLYIDVAYQYIDGVATSCPKNEPGHGLKYGRFFVLVLRAVKMEISRDFRQHIAKSHGGSLLKYPAIVTASQRQNRSDIPKH